MPPALFVYGTLMPGHLRWGILAPHARGHRPALASGVLYDTGLGWPAASFASAERAGAPEQQDGPVPGWLIDLDPSTASILLAQLDEIEGLAPAGATEVASLAGRYRRVQVDTDDGTVAWAYAAAHVDPTWVSIERWTTQAEQ